MIQDVLLKLSTSTGISPGYQLVSKTICLVCGQIYELHYCTIRTMIVPLISYEHLKNYITANLKHFFFYQSEAMNSILGQNVHWGLLKLGHASPFKGLLGQYITQTEFVTNILLTSSKNQIYEFRIPNIFCCLNENLTTFLYTLSLTEATRKQSVYISRMLLKK